MQPFKAGDTDTETPARRKGSDSVYSYKSATKSNGSAILPMSMSRKVPERGEP